MWLQLPVGASRRCLPAGRYKCNTWRRHQMETFSALLAICGGNSPVPGKLTAQRPVTGSFDVFFDLRLNKRLSKQSWGWWFKTLSHPLWRNCNELEVALMCLQLEYSCANNTEFRLARVYFHCKFTRHYLVFNPTFRNVILPIWHESRWNTMQYWINIILPR